MRTIKLESRIKACEAMKWRLAEERNIGFVDSELEDAYNDIKKSIDSGGSLGEAEELYEKTS